MGRKYLVTGGAGFIGSNFIRHLFANEPDANITNFDALTYAGVPATVAELDENPNHQFVEGDIRDPEVVGKVMPGHDVVVHLAAESHVDRSIVGPAPFLETNFVGTGVLLDAALRNEVPRFVHVSTDEVYGSLPTGSAAEDHPLDPSSPYSSSKAGSDLLARSYHITFGYDVVITRCTNNYGPYQFPDKVIPLFVTNLMDGKKVPLYGEGANQRDWLYVDDHCAALHLLVDKAVPGEVYNIGSGTQLSNLALTRSILEHLGMDESWIEPVPDRPGHDLRYALDSSKLEALGWAPNHDFTSGLAGTIDWYRERRDWWEPLKREPL
ncbi:MAG TPA: dTDP-glucose 4,6-dehydratase [Acidimicrobiia bacterium]